MKKFILIVIIFNCINLFSQTTVAFTTPGTTNWTVPTCITSITVQAWGGGGGGGSAWSKCSNGSGNEACAGAGGGGGGGYTTKVFSVNPGDIFAITVGAAGTGGTVSTTSGSGINGVNGGNSSCIGGTVNLTATGGSGGVKSQANNTQCAGCGHTRIAGAGGAGGSGNGTTTYNGGNGSDGQPSGSFDFSGSGGGGGGTTSAGSNGNLSVAGDPPVGGSGGATGGGKGGDGQKTAVNKSLPGSSGTILGAGGGGGLTHRTDYIANAYIAAGGAGARGEVRISHSGAIPPVLNISPAVCNTNSTSVNLSSTASSTNSPTYAWTNSGGTINSGSASLTPNVKGPGTFILVAYNGVPTCSASTNITLTNADCNLLRIELTNFSAEKENELVTLNWQTNYEVNNNYFVVEKSTNGLDFETHDVIKGSGNTSTKISYQSTDNKLSAGIMYYRLKQVDYDGKSTYSKIVSVDGIDADYSLSNPLPNPTSSEININFSAKNNSDFIIEVIDISGKKIKIFTEAIETGFSVKNFNISDLESGMYFILIKSTDGKYTVNHKIIKN